MLDHVTPFFALVSAVLVLLPLPWHIRSRNVGTVALSTWLFLGNVDNFVNSMVWWNSTSDKAPVFCELSIRLKHAVFIAIPASNLVIARKLESIASTRQVRTSAADSKKSVIIDLLISVGVPMVYVMLMIVNQSNRYAIIEEAGCWPLIFPSWVYVLLVAAPVIIVSLFSAIYSVLAFRWFWIRRRQFQAVLASSASNINRSRYIRLLLLTAADRLIFFPIYVGTIGKEIADAITLPYGSWSSVHAGFDERPQFKADVIEMQSTFKRNLILSRLVSPLSGYIFFAMFGLGQEACQGYKNALRRILVFCKLQKERKQPTPQAIVADIEVVTFQSRDTYSAAGASPSSEKFGAHAAKYEAA
ncbi:probable Pheromone receptor 1 [Melanopsichium pennsylvanicum]|uniref:Pheromone receptor a1 n=1 Tax=Melanopsichium pennsylvanicum TaxID=63383 RepID=H2CZ03_9BASI|nr:pheromone receptor a1 [Melanopsichium pennsylvanicum]SNX82060.1 probable Pheromone receptor 1 [Melanopsichium pennsylvanicum]